MKVLVIIPAYNEEDSIEFVISKLKKYKNDWKFDLDYIIVNDCSTDKTEDICRKNNFNYISLPVNLGIGGGVQTGYKYAVENHYDVAIQMDGDGQHDPKYIKDLVEEIVTNKVDMVIGSRFITNKGFQSSKMRRFGINFLKHLIRFCCGKSINDTTSGFRATSKPLTTLFSQCYAQDYPEPEAIITAVLNGFKIKEIPVIMYERSGGESSIKVMQTVYYMIKVSLAIIIYRMGFKKGVKR
ncbi:glycosyltransferase family 2 protein [Eubacterium sp. AM05-23]|uniref:glycosyltransferase family 2 protein n=1 Tax=Eubacterium TaxID=1730 RepID=UPI000E52048C|nr:MULTISPECIES: glycosyltransferase family 2 protein [Eubacterium]RHO55562.1 glycosyltransferase family 2 protein [Eubacterium sp. AM05-23]